MFTVFLYIFRIYKFELYLYDRRRGCCNYPEDPKIDEYLICVLLFLTLFQNRRVRL